MNFIDIVNKRRSYYNIGKNVNIDQNEIESIIKSSVRGYPSHFNSQGARVVILFNSQHDKLWNIVLETLKKIVPSEKFHRTEVKINSFKNGFGTVLFFEDSETSDKLKKDFPTYSENFDTWREQSNGMAQFSVWTALSSIDLGSSLQHYNPIIDDEVKKTWNLPSNWVLKAQMPFGSIEASPNNKVLLDDEKKFLTFK